MFYGVSYAVDDLGGNMYRNFLLATLTGIPSGLTYFYFSRRYVEFAVETNIH